MRTPPRGRLIRTLQSALLLLVSLSIALLFAEVILRALAPSQYFVWKPYTEKTFMPTPGMLPGVTGPSHFSINESGVRGEPFSGNQTFRALAIGGSTTESVYMDNTEAWPWLVQENVRTATGESGFWVGNVGKSGQSTRHHLLEVDKLLGQYPRIDLVFLLVGINEVYMALAQGDEFKPLRDLDTAQRQALLSEAFSLNPAADFSWDIISRSEIRNRYHLARKTLRAKLGLLVVQDEAGLGWKKELQQRRNATRWIDQPPDLTAPLAEFRQNLRDIARLARAHGATVMLMTQPSTYRRDLEPEYEAFIWGGQLANAAVPAEQGVFYTTGALAEALAQYNATLLEVCAADRLPCLDLASEVGHDPALFYDGIHFNEAGSRKVADAITRFVLAHTDELKLPRKNLFRG